MLLAAAGPCSASASARSCSPRRPAAAPAGVRARDRLARRELTPRAPRRPAARRPRARASRPSSGTATSARCPPGATALARSPVCLAGLPPGRPRLGDPVPRRGRAGRRRALDRRLPQRPRRRARSDLDPEALRAETRAVASTPGTSSAGRSAARFLTLSAGLAQSSSLTPGSGRRPRGRRRPGSVEAVMYVDSSLARKRRRVGDLARPRAKRPIGRCTSRRAALLGVAWRRAPAAAAC